MSAKAIPILMYHHVSPEPGLVTLSPQTFSEQMQWLAKSGWKTLTSLELEAFYKGEALPRKSVMLTFDDGYLDNWLLAYPILQSLGLHAHIFLTTDLIGEGPIRHEGYFYAHQECLNKIRLGQQDEIMLRWSEVKEMQQQGLIEFHPHTHTHQRWDHLFDDKQDRYKALENDIKKSQVCMQSRLGDCSKHLCWPEGYYDYGYINVAKKLGFEYLYTTERRINKVNYGSLRLGRISTKEREYSSWLKRRLFYYTTPIFSSLLEQHKGPRYT